METWGRLPTPCWHPCYCVAWVLVASLAVRQLTCVVIAHDVHMQQPPKLPARQSRRRSHNKSMCVGVVQSDLTAPACLSSNCLSWQLPRSLVHGQHLTQVHRVAMGVQQRQPGRVAAPVLVGHEGADDAVALGGVQPAHAC